MSASEVARTGELDRTLEAQDVSEQLAGELFGVVDVLDDQPALRRALTDPSLPERARTGLVGRLFGGKVSDGAVAVLSAAAALRWAGGRSFVDAVERQAVRADLLAASHQGRLDRVEDELFRFSRVVEGDNALRAALGETGAPLPVRQRLVDDLLDAKADQITIDLAKRAVSARQRTFALTLENYLQLSAAVRSREVAVVHVAKPMTPEQEERLRAALQKQTGHEVSLQVVVDPNVIGGVRVEMGDEVIEGTVAGRVETARRQLT